MRFQKFWPLWPQVLNQPLDMVVLANRVWNMWWWPKRLNQVVVGELGLIWPVSWGVMSNDREVAQDGSGLLPEQGWLVVDRSQQWGSKQQGTMESSHTLRRWCRQKPQNCGGPPKQDNQRRKQGHSALNTNHAASRTQCSNNSKHYQPPRTKWSYNGPKENLAETQHRCG